MTLSPIKAAIAKVLREQPHLHRLHKEGKAVEGRIVGLVLSDLQGGFTPKEVHVEVVEALLTWKPHLLTDAGELGLLHEPGGPPVAAWKVSEKVGTDPDPDNRFDVSRWSNTDLADRYRSEHKVAYSPKGETEEERASGLLSIPVLEFLNGRAWDNAALNVVRSLRPSSIRATTGIVTCDVSCWRVTVLLEGNGRTIKKISQEVEVGLVGMRYGSDVDDYIHNRSPPIQVGLAIMNPRGLTKLTMTKPTIP